MSDTPRTDNQEYLSDEDMLVVPAEFARQLERELNEANSEIERLKKPFHEDLALAIRMIGQSAKKSEQKGIALDVTLADRVSKAVGLADKYVPAKILRAMEIPD